MTNCEDCGDETTRRTRCKKCGILVCRWCYHHAHAGPLASEIPSNKRVSLTKKKAKASPLAQDQRMIETSS